MPFRYVAVHAPAKDRAPDEAATIAMLAGLPLWVRSVVAHPDTLSDVGRYRALGTRLVLENMDVRKFTARVADEMEKFFEDLPDAAFVLTWRTFAQSTRRWTRRTSCLIGSVHACDMCISARSTTGIMCRLPRTTRGCSPRS